ncbi:MAG TPA: cytochrome c [Chloroflexia bacterium]|nr:cytochrome c [Chloroflexia bacterium]
MPSGPAVLGGLLGLGTLAGLIACGDTAPAGPPVTVAPALQAGQAVFARYCNVCHPGGHRGAGVSLIATPLDDPQIAATVRGGRHSMPAFDTDRISDSDLQSLIGYIRTLR